MSIPVRCFAEMGFKWFQIEEEKEHREFDDCFTSHPHPIREKEDRKEREEKLGGGGREGEC